MDCYNLGGKIDLHMHTTVSDGTDTPEELLSRVKASGIRIFSVTDHDAIKGCIKIRELLTEEDPYFITGTEFSCRDTEGKYHILGYGIDLTSEAVVSLVEKSHAMRMEKIRTRLDFLEQEYNITFPEDEIRRLLSLDNPGKPHIGNLMVRYGYAKTKEEAIGQYINKLSFKTKYVRPEEIISGMLSEGGIPVLAHPSFGSGSQLITGEYMEMRLQRLISAGLQGVEAFYSGFPAPLREELLFLSEKYGLYVTAGSDYHGTNKKVIPGDTGLRDSAEIPSGMKRFFQRVIDSDSSKAFPL